MANEYLTEIQRKLAAAKPSQCKQGPFLNHSCCLNRAEMPFCISLHFWKNRAQGLAGHLRTYEKGGLSHLFFRVHLSQVFCSFLMCSSPLSLPFFLIQALGKPFGSQNIWDFSRFCDLQGLFLLGFWSASEAWIVLLVSQPLVPFCVDIFSFGRRPHTKEPSLARREVGEGARVLPLVLSSCAVGWSPPVGTSFGNCWKNNMPQGYHRRHRWRKRQLLQQHRRCGFTQKTDYFGAWEPLATPSGQ